MLGPGPLDRRAGRDDGAARRDPVKDPRLPRRFRRRAPARSSTLLVNAPGPTSSRPRSTPGGRRGCPGGPRRRLLRRGRRLCAGGSRIYVRAPRARPPDARSCRWCSVPRKRPSRPRRPSSSRGSVGPGHPPADACPPGTSRLRVTLSAAHRDEEVERLAAALAELGWPGPAEGLSGLRPDRLVVVAGTGTEVGKTWVAARLTSGATGAGRPGGARASRRSPSMPGDPGRRHRRRRAGCGGGMRRRGGLSAVALVRGADGAADGCRSARPSVLHAGRPRRELRWPTPGSSTGPTGRRTGPTGRSGDRRTSVGRESDRPRPLDGDAVRPRGPPPARRRGPRGRRRPRHHQRGRA